ncbi:hypothetical protein [Lactiplantibacillus herbarum]|nr:hypothetical protein [Lactiplantibacillus herbarum]
MMSIVNQTAILVAMRAGTLQPIFWWILMVVLGITYITVISRHKQHHQK